MNFWQIARQKLLLINSLVSKPYVLSGWLHKSFANSFCPALCIHWTQVLSVFVSRTTILLLPRTFLCWSLWLVQVNPS